MSLLRAFGLGLFLLGAVAVAQPAPAPSPPLRGPDEKAQCLKQCTGSPRDANGPSLLACLRRCEAAAATPASASPDAGR